MIETLRDWRRMTLIGLLGAAGILGAALISQFGFGLDPCTLCIYQRWPYVAMIALGGAALAFGESKPVAFIALLLAILASDVSIGLGIWHSGVEFGWFPTPGCEGERLGSGMSVGDAFGKSFAKPCDAREPFFLGLSMANWNVLTSVGLGLIFALALLSRIGFLQKILPGPAQA